MDPFTNHIATCAPVIPSENSVLSLPAWAGFAHSNWFT